MNKTKRKRENRKRKEFIQKKKTNKHESTIEQTNREIYEYCSSNSIKWKPRAAKLIKEIETAQSDIICLQEIDTEKSMNFWRLELSKLGYETRFLTRKSNGVMMGFLKTK